MNLAIVVDGSNVYVLGVEWLDAGVTWPKPVLVQNASTVPSLIGSPITLFSINQFSPNNSPKITKMGDRLLLAYAQRVSGDVYGDNIVNLAAVDTDGRIINEQYARGSLVDEPNECELPLIGIDLFPGGLNENTDTALRLAWMQEFAGTASRPPSYKMAIYLQKLERINLSNKAIPALYNGVT